MYECIKELCKERSELYEKQNDDLNTDYSTKSDEMGNEIWRIQLMITIDEVKQICNRLAEENADTLSDDVAYHDLSEEVSYIVYRTEVYETGDTAIVSHHVDIEYMFGNYCEIDESTPLFQFIATLCDLPLLQEEQEIVIYENKDME